MFKWLSKIRKEQKSEEKQNIVKYQSDEKTQNLIQKWLKDNNIDNKTFEEILFELGLTYPEILQLEEVSLNLSNPIWENPKYIGALKTLIYRRETSSVYQINENNSFKDYIAKLNSNTKLMHSIYLYRDSITSSVNYDNDRGYRNPILHTTITKDYSVNNGSLEETKEKLSIYTGRLVYNRHEYEFKREKTQEETKINSSYNKGRENSELTVSIKGKIIEMDDMEIRGYMWANNQASSLKRILDKILEYSKFEDDITIHIRRLPGAREIIYNKSKDGTITIKEVDITGIVYFNSETTKENNIYKRTISVYCNKRKVTLEITSSKEIQLEKETELLDTIYSLKNGILLAEEVFKKISSISFKNPSNYLLSVTLSEQINDKITKSKSWKRTYQFETNEELQDNDQMILKRK